MRDRRARRTDVVFAVLMVVLMGLVAATFRHYGISTDEDLHQIYGRLLWQYYASGLSDDAVFRFENLYLYGGLVDLTVEAAGRLLPFAPYDTRHLVQAAFGIIGIAGTFATARWLAGPRAGLLAAVLLSISGVYWGAQFTNGKDVPFAAGMIWLAYFGCRLLSAYPRAAIGPVVGFGVALGLTLGVRVGALLAVISLALAAGVLLLAELARRGSLAALGDGLRFAVRLSPAFVLAYGLMAIVWPWSVLEPLNPLRAVTGLTHFGSIPTMFAGHLYQASEVPVTYLPWYVLIKLPEVLWIGAALAALSGAIALRQRGQRQFDRPRARAWLLVCLAVAVPVAIAVVTRPALYSGMRHFLFVVPPLCVLAAGGWLAPLKALRRCHQPARTAGTVVLIGALAGLCAGTIITLIRLHPYEYVYVNSLGGGLAGAYRRYDTDYWSTSTREAIEVLAAHVRGECGDQAPRAPYRVAACTKSTEFEVSAPPFLRYELDWSAADLVIATTSGNCDLAAPGKTIGEIRRLGVALAVIKDQRTGGDVCR